MYSNIVYRAYYYRIMTYYTYRYSLHTCIIYVIYMYVLLSFSVFHCGVSHPVFVSKHDLLVVGDVKSGQASMLESYRTMSGYRRIHC